MRGRTDANVYDGRSTLASRKQSLEYVIHFIGDITQPLRDEAEALGSNHISVLWNGAKANMHSAWNTQMERQSLMRVVEHARARLCGMADETRLLVVAGFAISEIVKDRKLTHIDIWAKGPLAPRAEKPGKGQSLL